MKCARAVIEIVGEGRTELGRGKSPDEQKPTRPNQGVLPILVHSLCGRPDAMLVKCRKHSSLQGKTRAQKVQFAKRQAMYNGSAGMVFVVDSDGDWKGRIRELTDGRNREHPQYPAAVGVAHPCIEAWLLADATAVQQGLSLLNAPAVCDDPEKLPAPCRDRNKNPKTVLCDVAGKSAASRQEISAQEKDRIATAMNDMNLLRTRCPRSFAPFADEVEKHISPLF